MNQQQWQPPSRSPGGGGSVRRARERVEAGSPPDMPQPPAPQGERLYEPPRIVDPRRNRPRAQMPPGLAGSKNGGPIGVAISRPTQVPQWPLAGTIEGGPDQRNQQYQPPAGRGVAPQRPPRPSHVPSMVDASRLQGPMPTFQYQAPKRNIDEDEIVSPVLQSPNTQSSRPSTVSSVGSIPDFPVPQIGLPRRSANLGPPPTSRRGASSYYSQASYVSPIPEESPRTNLSHGSYASSAAIPSTWGSQDSPDFDYDDEDDEAEIFEPGRQFGNDRVEGRESRESNGTDDGDGRGLIRSASLGKRAKPSVVNTRSAEKADPSRPVPKPLQVSQKEKVSKLEKMGVVGGSSGAVAPLNVAKSREQRDTVWPIIGDINSPLATGTGFIDSSSNSDESVPQITRPVRTNEPAPNNTAAQPDQIANAMLEAYHGASALSPIGPPPLARTPSPGYSRLSAIRRPPKLDMDAVRDAEARGSLTSLPDLIRRATRLAAMMDRGKRPGSRLALDDFPSGDFGRDKELGLIDDEKHRSGLSGMLAAFPPPGIATPDRVGTPAARPVSSWPNAYDPDSEPNSAAKPPKRRRRCCGLPVWAFCLVLLILAITIAAAVVVPLELLVFHKPKSSGTTRVSALAACSTNISTACQNGGTSVLDGDACACICTNGFTGATCTFSNSPGCTTTTLPVSGATATAKSATLGSAIPRIIQGAESNFSIPLNVNTILARFNSANASCGAENALITFDGRSGRLGGAEDLVSSISSSSPTPTPSAGKRNKRDVLRDEAATTTTPLPTFTTSSPSFSGTTTIPSFSTTSSPAPSSTSTPPLFSPTETTLDFARTVVLFILQQSSLTNAVSSQVTLQHFFSLPASVFTVQAARNITLGNWGTVDLVALKVDLGNGLVGGGANNSLSGRDVIQGREAVLWTVDA